MSRFLGQFSDLVRLLECGGHPPELSYIFLGDYVDRGNYGIECVMLLICYKIAHPDKLYMLRGNHECGPISRIYGFYDEVKRRFNVKMWKTFCDVFNALPLAATIDDKICCMHAGLSPEIMSDISAIGKVKRPCDVPEEGLVCDLLWSDPDPDVVGSTCKACQQGFVADDDGDLQRARSRLYRRRFLQVNYHF